MKRLKSSLLFAALTMGCSIGMANDVDVKTFRYAGPFDLSQPVLVDSVDAQQKAFSAESLLNTPLNLDLAQQGRVINEGKLPTSSAQYALNLLQFNIQNASYCTLGVELKGLKHYQVYVDNKVVSPSSITLLPQTHSVVLRSTQTRAVHSHWATFKTDCNIIAWDFRPTDDFLLPTIMM